VIAVSDHFRKVGIASPRAATLTFLAVSFYWHLDSYATGLLKIMRYHFGSGYACPFSSLPVGPDGARRAGYLVVSTEVALDKVALLEGVLDWIAMVAAQHLDYLVKTDVVELVSLLLMDPVDHRDELAITTPPAALLAFYLSITVFSLVHGFGLSLVLVLAEDCTDSLRIEGVACSI
jgi:hypothetical protein